MNTVTICHSTKSGAAPDKIEYKNWTKTDRDYLKSKKAVDRLKNAQFKHFPVPLIINIILNQSFGYVASDTTVDGAITFNFRNNVSALHKCVLTPWIAMHRVFHMVQVPPTWLGNKLLKESIKQLSTALNEFNTAFKMLADAYELEYIEDGDFWQLCSTTFAPNHELWSELLYTICTFRSARKRIMSFNEEVAPELFAQYTVTGSITFNPLPDSITVETKRACISTAPPPYTTPAETTTLVRKHDVDMEQVAALIESAFDKLIALMPGKQLAF